MAGIRRFASMGSLPALMARARLCSPSPAPRPLMQASLVHVKHLNLYLNHLGQTIKIKMFPADACGQKYFLSPGQDGSRLPSQAPAPTNVQLHKWQQAEKMLWPQWPSQPLQEHHMASAACDQIWAPRPLILTESPNTRKPPTLALLTWGNTSLLKTQKATLNFFKLSAYLNYS